jgi:cytochrome P450
LSARSFFGHAAEYREDPLGLLMRFNAECGDAGFLNFHGVSLFVVNTPALVRELLVDKASSFRKSPAGRAALYPLMGDGLFTSEGETWRSQRKLMAPMFHPSRIDGFGRSMSDAAVRAVASLRSGDVVDVTRETTRITMTVACKTLFDTDTFDEADALGEALTAALHWVADAAQSFTFGVQVELSNRLTVRIPKMPMSMRSLARCVAEGFSLPWVLPTAKHRRLRAAIRVLDDRVQRMIAERRRDPKPREDLLSRLLDARDDKTGERLSDRELRDEVVTLLVAGHETTATALSWALYYLARERPLYEAAEAEARAIDHVPGADDLPRLPLTLRVFKEALRICPPVSEYERLALEPVTIAGHTMAAGHAVAVFPWALHHRESLWPDPERFDPGRFEPAAEAARPRHAYVPFGAGPRVCIGSHFALLEGPLVLATLMREARFTLVDDTVVRPDPMAATLRPQGGIRMRIAR